MSKVSVIIPSYRDPLLNKTIESVLSAAKEDIEIIAILDAEKLDCVIQDGPVKYIQQKENIGMRSAINIGVDNSSGKYLMKLDSHCNIMDGFDVILKTQTDENMVSIPSRYNLNAKDWSKYNGPIDYLYLKYPKFKRETIFRMGLFKKKIKKKNNPMVDDIIAFQGACWFMHKKMFKRIGGLDDKTFGSFGAESHEISMKVWLTTNDGRLVRNRNVWYAHYRPDDVWKGKPKKLRKTMLHSMKTAFKLDMLNEWRGQVKTFKWVMSKFGPFPGWPEDWYTEEYINKLKADGII